MAPQSFGRYEVIRPLGEGGMADVYLAWDATLERDVAIKAPQVERLSPTLLARFRHEARAVARLAHEAIVPLYDFGEQDGRPFLVMRYMPGGSLAERLVRGPLKPGAALPIVARVAGALDHAHARGIVHRDVKPGNILFDDDGSAYLSDFGIARFDQYSGEETAAHFTQPGQILGTAAYVSPEQVREVGAIGPASDVYSLGIVVFEMLAGRIPFNKQSSTLRAAQHVQDPIPSIREWRRALPAEIEAVFARALAKQPQDRYGSAGEFAADLRRIVEGAPPAVILALQPASGARVVERTLKIEVEPEPAPSTDDLLRVEVPPEDEPPRLLHVTVPPEEGSEGAGDSRQGRRPGAPGEGR